MLDVEHAGIDGRGATVADGVVAGDRHRAQARLDKGTLVEHGVDREVAGRRIVGDREGAGGAAQVEHAVDHGGAGGGIGGGRDVAVEGEHPRAGGDVAAAEREGTDGVVLGIQVQHAVGIDGDGGSVGDFVVRQTVAIDDRGAVHGPGAIADDEVAADRLVRERVRGIEDQGAVIDGGGARVEVAVAVERDGAGAVLGETAGVAGGPDKSIDQGVARAVDDERIGAHRDGVRKVAGAEGQVRRCARGIAHGDCAVRPAEGEIGRNRGAVGIVGGAVGDVAPEGQRAGGAGDACRAATGAAAEIEGANGVGAGVDIQGAAVNVDGGAGQDVVGSQGERAGVGAAGGADVGGTRIGVGPGEGEGAGTRLGNVAGPVAAVGNDSRDRRVARSCDRQRVCRVVVGKIHRAKCQASRSCIPRLVRAQGQDAAKCLELGVVVDDACRPIDAERIPGKGEGIGAGRGAKGHTQCPAIGSERDTVVCCDDTILVENKVITVGRHSAGAPIGSSAPSRRAAAIPSNGHARCLTGQNQSNKCQDREANSPRLSNQGDGN